MLIAAVIYRGLPTDPGGWGAIGIAAIILGATFVWTLIKLMREDHLDGL